VAFLVQVLLPLFGRDGSAIDEPRFAAVRRELTERFGGVTAYMRSPAAGLWRREDGTVDRDQMVMVEVMVDALDRAWWAGYRTRLETRFDQDAIVARAIAIERL
jgi:hypothetical protein